MTSIKAARTHIYRAIFGHGGRQNNDPFSDTERQRLPGWNAQDARQQGDCLADVT